MSDQAPQPQGVRVSDADRETVAEELRQHAGAGRLDTEELEQRVSAAYAARTRSELDALRRDLPAVPPPPVPVRQRRRDLGRRVLAECGGSLGLFVICVAIWAASGANGSFWPVWVLVIFVMALVRNGSALLGGSDELDRLEERLDRHADRHADRAERRADRRR